MPNLLTAPLAGAPVKGHALVNQKAHRPHRLLNGRVHVRPVAEDEVDVVRLQAIQRGFRAFNDVLAREALIVGPLPAPEDFGGQHQVGPRPAGILNDVAHHDLRLSARIGLSVVEKVDARIVSRVHAGGRAIFVDLVAKRHPRPKREGRHFEARMTQETVVHVTTVDV